MFTDYEGPPVLARHIGCGRDLPNAKLTIYPDSGHSGVFQYHREFVLEVLEFLES